MRRFYRTVALFIVTIFFISCGTDSDTPNPEITGIQPESGPPGTMVTISGSGFSAEASGNSVSFGGTSAPVTSASESQIETEVPDGIETGSAQVEVTVGEETATGPAFTVEMEAPGISSVEPDSGTVGTEVTIEGMNFSTTASENSITFDGTQAPVNSATGSELVTEVPQGATDGPIVVTVKQKSTTGPEFDVITEGTMEVTTATSGSDKDADGYELIVDGANSSIGTSETLYVSGLEEGSHNAELSNVAGNCSVSGDNPRSVDITAGDTTSTTFDVSCQAVAKGEIAFSSDRDGDTEVFLMNADGSNPRKLTDNSASESNVAISHDGTKIAFISDRNSGNNNVYIMDADGSDVQQVTSSSAHTAFPSWSPDDSQLVFNDSRDGQPDIYKINADGSGLEQLTSGSDFDQGASWSPDGSEIAFQSDRDGDNEIYVMNSDGTGLQQITDNSSDDDFAVWSPDGSKFAFRSNRDGNQELYIMNTDGSGVSRLTNDPDFDSSASWSPDGNEIAFSTTRDGQFEVYKMNADGSGGLVNLTANSAYDGAPDWSPVE